METPDIMGIITHLAILSTRFISLYIVTLYTPKLLATILPNDTDASFPSPLPKYFALSVTIFLSTFWIYGE